MPFAILANIFLFSHNLLLFHSPKGSWNVTKYEKLGEYFPYCTRHHAITTIYSSPCMSPITGNILITVERFARYHLLLASNSTFKTDSQYLCTIQVWQNLNKQYYLKSTKSVICQTDTNCSPFQLLNLIPLILWFPQAGTLKIQFRLPPRPPFPPSPFLNWGSKF